MPLQSAVSHAINPKQNITTALWHRTFVISGPKCGAKSTISFEYNFFGTI
jgi:hypothetical protein